MIRQAAVYARDLFRKLDPQRGGATHSNVHRHASVTHAPEVLSHRSALKCVLMQYIASLRMAVLIQESGVKCPMLLRVDTEFFTSRPDIDIRLGSSCFFSKTSTSPAGNGASRTLLTSSSDDRARSCQERRCHATNRMGQVPSRLC